MSREHPRSLPTLALSLASVAFLLAACERPAGRANGPANVSVDLDRLDRDRIPAEERFDWQPRELVAVIGSHRGRHWGEVAAVAVSPDGKRIASGGYDRAVRLWDAETLRAVTVLTEHKGSVFTVAFSPDGNTLATAGADDGIRMWDLTAPEPKVTQVLKGHKGDVRSVAYTADGKTLASGDAGGIVLLWDLSRSPAALRATLSPERVHGNYRRQAVAFSPDGKALAASDQFDVILWDVTARPPKPVRTLKPKTGDLKRDLDDHPSVVQSLVCTPDGKTLVAAHYNGSGTRLWDLAGEDLSEEI